MGFNVQYSQFFIVWLLLFNDFCCTYFVVDCDIILVSGDYTNLQLLGIYICIINHLLIEIYNLYVIR